MVQSRESSKIAGSERAIVSGFFYSGVLSFKLTFLACTGTTKWFFIKPTK